MNLLVSSFMSNPFLYLLAHRPLQEYAASEPLNLCNSNESDIKAVNKKGCNKTKFPVFNLLTLSFHENEILVTRHVSFSSSTRQHKETAQWAGDSKSCHCEQKVSSDVVERPQKRHANGSIFWNFPLRIWVVQLKLCKTLMWSSLSCQPDGTEYCPHINAGRFPWKKQSTEEPSSRNFELILTFAKMQITAVSPINSISIRFNINLNNLFECHFHLSSYHSWSAWFLLPTRWAAHTVQILGMCRFLFPTASTQPLTSTRLYRTLLNQHLDGHIVSFGCRICSVVASVAASSEDIPVIPAEIFI